MPQSQSNGPHSEAGPSKLATSLPRSLLNLLEPGVDGEWKITGQSQKSFMLSFIMKQGSEALHYTISPCLTKAEVEKECADFIYEYHPGRHPVIVPPSPPADVHELQIDKASSRSWALLALLCKLPPRSQWLSLPSHQLRPRLH